MKKITEVKAAGSNIVIELLNAEETFQTSLKLSDNSKVEAPQAYIIDIGPLVDNEKFGFFVGDRILLSGMMTPTPKCGSNRQRGIIDAYAIKAVLKEQSALLN